MIVLDAGAFVEVLRGSAGGRTVGDLLKVHEAAVPHLFDAEVLAVLVRERKAGALAAVELAERVEVLRDARVERFPHGSLLAAAARLADALSGYDALYVALAVALDCPLVTADRRLAGTVTGQLGVATVQIPSSGRPHR